MLPEFLCKSGLEMLIFSQEVTKFSLTHHVQIKPCVFFTLCIYLGPPGCLLMKVMESLKPPPQATPCLFHQSTVDANDSLDPCLLRFCDSGLCPR